MQYFGLVARLLLVRPGASFMVDVRISRRAAWLDRPYCKTPATRSVIGSHRGRCGPASTRRPLDRAYLKRKPMPPIAC